MKNGIHPSACDSLVALNGHIIHKPPREQASYQTTSFGTQKKSPRRGSRISGTHQSLATPLATLHKLTGGILDMVSAYLCSERKFQQIRSVQFSSVQRAKGHLDSASYLGRDTLFPSPPSFFAVRPQRTRLLDRNLRSRFAQVSWLAVGGCRKSCARMASNRGEKEKVGVKPYFRVTGRRRPAPDQNHSVSANRQLQPKLVRLLKPNKPSHGWDTLVFTMKSM